MDRPCICSHSKASHHTRMFRDRNENTDFEDLCYRCMDEDVWGKCHGYYKPMANLEWLEFKAMKKVS